MKDFTDKVVVITGGATGIGYAFAKRFGQEGAKIVIASRRKAKIDAAVQQLSELGIEARGTTCDVSKRTDVEALADFAWSEFGKVDVLINNAGVPPSENTLFDLEEEQLQQVLDINIIGTWRGVKVFGKRLLEQGTPCAIYNIGSENGLYCGLPVGGEYIASKHAITGMTDQLRLQAPDFMDIALICPGMVMSEMMPPGMSGMPTDEFIDIAIKQLKAGEFYVVSHPYDMVHIGERYEEISNAYGTYAPRYEGDDEYDAKTNVLKMLAQMQENQN